MHTDKDLLMKGVRRLLLTVVLMFLAPTVLFQAFKNQLHPWYWIVLGIGLVLAITAVVMGFLGVKTIVDAIFNKAPQKNKD
ncbi:MAG: DUF6095 family protein [Flavobacteriaceae bacterium]